MVNHFARYTCLLQTENRVHVTPALMNCIDQELSLRKSVQLSGDATRKEKMDDHLTENDVQQDDVHVLVPSRHQVAETDLQTFSSTLEFIFYFRQANPYTINILQIF